MVDIKTINYYLDKSYEENFDLSQLRKELENSNFNPDDIKEIIRLIDNDLQKRAVINSNINRAKEMIYIGVFLVFVGLGITLSTYIGLVKMGDSFLVVYGPFIGGISLILTGYTKMISSNERTFIKKEK
jgi:hypothetical protein